MVETNEGADGKDLAAILGMTRRRMSDIEGLVTAMIEELYTPAQEILDEGANRGVVTILTSLSLFCKTQAEFAYGCLYTGSMTKRHHN